jgi:hypothetical protein
VASCGHCGQSSVTVAHVQLCRRRDIEAECQQAVASLQAMSRRLDHQVLRTPVTFHVSCDLPVNVDLLDLLEGLSGYLAGYGATNLRVEDSDW